MGGGYPIPDRSGVYVRDFTGSGEDRVGPDYAEGGAKLFHAAVGGVGRESDTKVRRRKAEGTELTPQLH